MGHKSPSYFIDMKCVINGNSCNVGLNGDYRHCPWTYFRWPCGVKGQGHDPLTRNISKTETNARLDPMKHLHVGPTGFRLAPSRFDLAWPSGVKTHCHTFWHEICDKRPQLRCGTQRRLQTLLMDFTLDDLTILWFEISWKRWRATRVVFYLCGGSLLPRQPENCK